MTARLTMLTTAGRLLFLSIAVLWLWLGCSGADELPRSDGLERVLARLRLRASGQTPADTSLLPPPPPPAAPPAAPPRLHVKASGQTPADTSLLPPAQSRRAAAKAPPGRTPANVGLLQPGRAPGGAPESGVRRQETTSFKQLNGESVRVVVGNYGYQSPEGLPVSFNYMSDENGNQARFAIGAASGASASGAAHDGPSKAAAAAASDGPSKAPPSKAAAAAGPAGAADRVYLPPK